MTTNTGILQPASVTMNLDIFLMLSGLLMLSNITCRMPIWEMPCIQKYLHLVVGPMMQRQVNTHFSSQLRLMSPRIPCSYKNGTESVQKLNLKTLSTLTQFGKMVMAII